MQFADVTLDQIEQTVRQLATENPAFIYQPDENNAQKDMPRCLYREKDGKPGCIFGHAFDRLGVLDEILETYPRQTASIFSILVEWPEEEVRWFASVQAAQDGGRSWGEAVALADWRYRS